MPRGSNNSYHIHTTSYALSMLQSGTEYRKVQKKSDGKTLLITVPFRFAEAIPLRKNDTVKMTLRDDKSIVVTRATD